MNASSDILDNEKVKLVKTVKPVIKKRKRNTIVKPVIIEYRDEMEDENIIEKIVHEYYLEKYNQLTKELSMTK